VEPSQPEMREKRGVDGNFRHSRKDPHKDRGRRTRNHSIKENVYHTFRHRKKKVTATITRGERGGGTAPHRDEKMVHQREGRRNTAHHRGEKKENPLNSISVRKYALYQGIERGDTSEPNERGPDLRGRLRAGEGPSHLPPLSGIKKSHMSTKREEEEESGSLF